MGRVKLIDADVSGTGMVGALIGMIEKGAVYDCHSTGKVRGVFGVGGLIGAIEGTMSNCSADCDVDGVGDVGPLAGLNATAD